MENFKNLKLFKINCCGNNLINLIGKGRLGDTYRLNTNFAIKCINKNALNNELVS